MIQSTYKKLSKRGPKWENIRIFAFKIWNEARMFRTTTSLILAAGVLVRTLPKKKKMIIIQREKNWKEEIKLSLYAADMIIYIENPRNLQTRRNNRRISQGSSIED